MKTIWLVFGLLSLALGMVGAILPLIPTVPLLLLAAFCFARSSDRLHDWLVNHPVFGPSIQDWRERGAIGQKAKRLATLSIAAVFLLSVVMGVKTTVIVIQAIVLSCVLIFIWTRPSD